MQISHEAESKNVTNTCQLQKPCSGSGGDKNFLQIRHGADINNK